MTFSLTCRTAIMIASRMYLGLSCLLSNVYLSKYFILHIKSHVGVWHQYYSVIWISVLWRRNNEAVNCQTFSLLLASKFHWNQNIDNGWQFVNHSSKITWSQIAMKENVYNIMKDIDFSLISFHVIFFFNLKWVP